MRALILAAVYGLMAEEWSLQVLGVVAFTVKWRFLYVPYKERKYCIFILSMLHSSDWRLMFRLDTNVLK